MRRYFTGLIPNKEEIPPRPICGTGWKLEFERPPPTLGDALDRKHEIVIYALNRFRAEAVLGTILDALTVLEWLNMWSDSFVVIPADARERSEENPADVRGRPRLSTSGLIDACRLAAIASRRKKWSYALALYRLSTTIHVNHPSDLDPGKFPYQQRSLSLRDHVRFAYALVVSYAVIETLGLALHQDAFAKGAWIPEKKDELEARLRSAGVDLNETILWHVRGGQTRLETARILPSVTKAEWSRYRIRDFEVQITDAIAHLRWLRARTAAHDIKKFTHQLSVHDVANAQQVARRLIMNVMIDSRKRRRNPP